MKLLKILVSLSLALSATVFARMGTEGGNGGDICEDRIKVLRDDLSSWIRKGGATGLSLPKNVSNAQYVQAMSNRIANAQISCTSSRVEVAGSEKTCMNYVDAKGAYQILCNASRFLDTKDSDQYILIHHEYAGLAGLEVNQGPESHYEISNQISGYLVDQVVKRLAVKPLANRSLSRKGIKTCFDGSYAGYFAGNTATIRNSHLSMEAGPATYKPLLDEGTLTEVESCNYTGARIFISTNVDISGGVFEVLVEDIKTEKRYHFFADPSDIKWHPEDVKAKATQFIRDTLVVILK
jgi:hypothetical protein